MIQVIISKIAEQWSLFYNSAKNLQVFFFFFLHVGTKAWSQQSVPVGPGGGWEGVTVLGLCVRWRVSYSSCFALSALPGLGGLKTL